jgi:hypothetical protein
MNIYYATMIAGIECKQKRARNILNGNPFKPYFYGLWMSLRQPVDLKTVAMILGRDKLKR